MATQVPPAEFGARRHGPHPRLAKGLRMAAVLMLLLAGWGFLQVSPPGVTAAFVDFTSDTSYAAALQTITDLGLQTALPCSGGAWVPMGERDLLQMHRLWVLATPIAAPAWFGRLRTDPSVTHIDGGPFRFACPNASVPPVGPVSLGEDAPTVYMRVTLGTATAGYDDALAQVADLGLRLADPCYERSWTRHLPVVWHSMGQAGAFASGRALVVATTEVAPTTWQDRLGQSASVSGIEAPYAPSC
jgi:hypothetical protein